jgi:hypothetical protein
VPDLKNNHWTSDETLLEEYVSGHLSAEQAAELEKHLGQCDQCRAAVSREQEVAAGIRRAGRDALKSRLAQRLEQKRGSGMNWYRAVGVAAAIVILITLGIYNRWFFSGSPPHAENRVKVDSVAPPLESPAIESKTQKMTPTQTTAEGQKPAAEQKKSAAYAGAAERDKSAAGAGVAQQGNPANISVSGGRMDAVSLASGKDEIWVQGSMITNPAEKQAALQDLKKDAEVSQDISLKRKEEPRGVMYQAARAQRPVPQAQSVTVVQRSLLDLPLSQKGSEQKLSRVQTLFQRDTTGLRLTLFLDSLLNAGELSRAQIQAIQGDSIILQIGSQRIGYKMPPGWSEQRTRDLKRAK